MQSKAFALEGVGMRTEQRGACKEIVLVWLAEDRDGRRDGPEDDRPRESEEALRESKG